MDKVLKIGIPVALVIVLLVWYFKRKKQCACGCNSCGNDGQKLKVVETQLTIVDPVTGKEYIGSDFGESTTTLDEKISVKLVGVKVADAVQQQTGTRPTRLQYKIYDYADNVIQSGYFKPA